ncbi:alpha/beta hydrolase [Taibaiella sp. KBW10]|uniref:alpha/beta hydrolase family protein n=1 Tax=Taibaiella sp. KBW10 TaxID=2153357 RepID=UPI000F59A473|nr:alpha/beta hydrolase [Taibaiella sp. KBW10]RQO30318.1 alpha/beta hydrolase [Taibaiella sp. KBW10]
MNKIALTLLLNLIALISSGQNIAGTWKGDLKIQSVTLELVLNIQKTDSGYLATMDSPDQGTKGIPVSDLSFDQSVLRLSIPAIGMTYEGKMVSDSLITGTFKQRGQSLPLNLERAAKSRRPQEPLKPYPYYEEAVHFENKAAGIQLAGTLSLPEQKGTYPVVVLVSGSGPQNRDEELLGHKPFLVLADFLTRNGFAVLRYDDRGTAASTGNFAKATTRDFADDALAAVAYLRTRKEINKKKIGIIGHSEGGVIAPMMAVQSKDIAFIVTLAGPGVPGASLLLQQQLAIAAANGVAPEQAEKSNKVNKALYDIVVKSADEKEAGQQLNSYLKQSFKTELAAAIPAGASEDALIQKYVTELSSPWIRYFLKYDPSKDLERLSCPILALFGEKDVQVPAKENAEAVRNALQKANNSHASVLELPNLNHLFQECSTGAPQEYATIEQTISPKALTEILNWLKYQAKQKH